MFMENVKNPPHPSQLNYNIQNFYSDDGNWRNAFHLISARNYILRLYRSFVPKNSFREKIII